MHTITIQLQYDIATNHNTHINFIYVMQLILLGVIIHIRFCIVIYREKLLHQNYEELSIQPTNGWSPFSTVSTAVFFSTRYTYISICTYL